MNARQSEAQDRRSRMIGRRQELTSKIRKQKKSEYLAKKRNLPVGGVTSSSSSSLLLSAENIKELLQAYCRSPSLDTLKALHHGLTSTPLKASENNPLVFFSQEEDLKASAIPFLRLLRQSSSSDQNNAGLVLEIMVRLTAISCPPSSSSSGYYGHAQVTWSALLSQDPEWLSYLVQAAPAQPNSVFVILGNLVGEDSTAVQSSLRQAGVIHVLVAAIRHPAAAWALTNAIRSDTTTLGSFYFSDNLLTPQLLEQLLLKEPAVSTQAAWMIASLTSREYETVHYMMGHATFCQTLLKCLEQPSSKDQLMALIQAFGNIANFESCVAPLLSFPSFPRLIGQFLQQTGNRELVAQSADLAGCLLYGAGLPDHPSTTVAAPILVPIMFQQLNDDRSLEEKRELASALWVALDLLPGPELSIVPIPIPPRDSLRPSLRTLVSLLESPDSDAVIAAVNVLDLLLRRDEGLQVCLEEENIQEALEAACEFSTMPETAEVAANLLDDFFYNFDEPEMDDPSQQEGFGLNFGPVPENPGLGRGRGAVVPSWISKSQ
jgi:hypothetical protein